MCCCHGDDYCDRAPAHHIYFSIAIGWLLVTLTWLKIFGKLKGKKKKN